jgi:L,D-transpeptidase ErfK/SrfK
MSILRSILFSLIVLPAFGFAESYPLPDNQDNVIGQVQQIASAYEDTFSQLARTYDLGYMEIRLANPKVDPWLPGTGTTIILPKLYVLPDAPHEGIVINLAEMRLYYYPPATAGQARTVETYPIGIGRDAFPTPELSTAVKARIPQPAWYPPESIIAEHAASGQTLPRTVPPGPDNPLGDYAIQLGTPGYFIHGTNRPGGVGLRVSHGCIRMYPEDIAKLFNEVVIGTPVRVVHQPIKVGILDGSVFVEAHPATQYSSESLAWQVTEQLQQIVGNQNVVMNWEVVDRVAGAQNGIPTAVAELSPANTLAIAH